MATYDFDAERGKRLREAREAVRPKLSQEELGNRIGSHRVSITNWEKGEKISDDRLEALSKALKRDKEWFLYGDKGPPLPQAVIESITKSTLLAVEILVTLDIDLRSDEAEEFLSAVIRQASESGPMSDTAIRAWAKPLLRK